MNVTHRTFDMLNLLHKITVMMINTEQRCTMSYSDRMCDLNCPVSETYDVLKKKNSEKYDILRKNFLVLFSN